MPAYEENIGRVQIRHTYLSFSGYFNSRGYNMLYKHIVLLDLQKEDNNISFSLPRSDDSTFW